MLLHPFESVTVTVYVPGASPVAVEVVCKGTVDHEYVKGAMPLLAATVADPFAESLQSTFV